MSGSGRSVFDDGFGFALAFYLIPGLNQMGKLDETISELRMAIALKCSRSLYDCLPIYRAAFDLAVHRGSSGSTSDLAGSRLRLVAVSNVVGYRNFVLRDVPSIPHRSYRAGLPLAKL